MIKSFKLAFCLVLLSCALAAGLLRPAAAADKPAPKLSGTTISPAFQQVTVLAGEQAHNVEFKITNNEPGKQSFDLSVQDFNTLGESGGLFFAGTNPTALQQKYGLAKWFSLPSRTLTLAAGQSQVIQAQVLNQPDLTPGGHYGALLVAVHPDSAKTSTSKVTLHPIASSLMFVTKSGGDIHSLELSKVSDNHRLLKLPSRIDLRFHNTGNTHVIPRGSVTVTGPGGKLISKGVINQDSNIILPEAYRQFSVPMKPINHPKSIGKYQLRVDFRFDGLDQYREYRSSFSYVPRGIIFVLILLILMVIGLWTARRRKIWPSSILKLPKK
jgi:hypothetical protein